MQLFELRVTEALESEEFCEPATEDGVAFQFDELVGGHALFFQHIFPEADTNEIKKDDNKQNVTRQSQQINYVAI